MKLLTKRLLAVAIVIAMTLGMAISAMALDRIDDAKLEEAGLDPALSVIIKEWTDVRDAAEANGASDEAGVEYVTKNADGTYTIDWSDYASHGYVKFAMVHNYAGNGQEIVAGTVMTVDSLSPFCLVGQRKGDGSDVNDDDNKGNGGNGSHKGGKSSSSGKKSPKTGMNDSWMLWLMAAGVFAGASVVAYNKKKG